MNNSQFRNLLQNEKPSKSPGDASSAAPAFKTPMLGSRARSSIPMTPRSVAGHNPSRDFARQVAEHKRQVEGEPPAKRFKSKAAPRGTRLAQGYQDRTQLRREEDEDDGPQDDKEKRLKALEEMYKLQQIDLAMFERLRDEIGVGGDIGSTHLVKGLDWKLLEKVRRGDEVNETPAKEEAASDEEEAEVEVDEELDSVLDKEVVAAATEKETDQGNSEADMRQAEVLTRDEILRRLKESRTAKQAPAPPPEVVLGDRFKKVASSTKPEKKKFVETINGRRREVLVITNQQGKTKRKSRWLDPEPAQSAKKPAQEAWGMDVPAEFAARQKALLEQEAAEEEDDDIFQGVGADYNPLGDIDSDSEGPEAVENKATDEAQAKAVGTDVTARPRNYFSTKAAADSEQEQARPIAQDPTIMAALKRAAALRQAEDGKQSSPLGGTDDSDPERALKRRQFLDKLKQQERDDAGDMDMGFGESRFEDDEDEGPVWEGDEGEEGGGQKKGSGRKRGGKKRKGDKDSVADVMGVLEGRKKDPRQGNTVASKSR